MEKKELNMDEVQDVVGGTIKALTKDYKPKEYKCELGLSGGYLSHLEGQRKGIQALKSEKVPTAPGMSRCSKYQCAPGTYNMIPGGFGGCGTCVHHKPVE